MVQLTTYKYSRVSDEQQHMAPPSLPMIGKFIMPFWKETSWALEHLQSLLEAVLPINTKERTHKTRILLLQSW